MTDLSQAEQLAPLLRELAHDARAVNQELARRGLTALIAIDLAQQHLDQAAEQAGKEEADKALAEKYRTEESLE